MITASLEKEGEKLAYRCFTNKVNSTVVYIERQRKVREDIEGHFRVFLLAQAQFGVDLFYGHRSVFYGIFSKKYY